MSKPDDLETRAKNGEWLTSEEADKLDERRRRAEGRPTWREEREALRAMTPEERQGVITTFAGKHPLRRQAESQWANSAIIENDTILHGHSGFSR